MNTWNRKSATFIERQQFCFLSNFMSKGNRSNHNEIAATAWRQRNADWWSEMKKAIQNLAKSTTPIDETSNFNDEAAGRLSHSDLHLKITAALEGKQKQQHAYHALANNYASLMCSFKMKFHSGRESITSSIFIQNKHEHLEHDTENAISLTNMRAAIHKLQPQDLEFPIPEKTTSHIGNDGPKEVMMEDPYGTTFHSCPNNIYHQLLDIIQMILTDQQYQYLIIQLKTYRLNDAQWNELKSTMNSHTDSFTDNQWIQVQNLLSHNRLNDGQFNIFTDMVDTSRQKLVLLHAGGGTGKHL